MAARAQTITDKTPFAVSYSSASLLSLSLSLVSVRTAYARVSNGSLCRGQRWPAATPRRARS